MKPIAKTPHADSPSVIVPIMMAYFNPSSVADWGCNVGVWCDAFKAHGVKNVHGFDVWARGKNSHLSKGEFTQVNFEDEIPVTKVDIAINLENAEHVSEGRADTLIDSLTESADVVMFSAATPGQGGDCHINEQPHSYWHSKFALRGYVVHDIIRWCVCDNPKVEWWYRNNMFVYVKSPWAK